MYSCLIIISSYILNLQAPQEDHSTPLDAHHPALTFDNFEVTCSFKSLQMMPLAFDYKMHFVPHLSTDGNTYQQVEICDLQNGVLLEKAQPNATTNSIMNPSLCSTMLNYSGKITIFGSISKKIGLHSLDANKKFWELVDSSDFSFQNIDFQNCVCYKGTSSDNVVVVTVLQAFIYFYLFSPVKNESNTYWKSAKLSLSQQISSCQIQSCVVLSTNLFCSLLTSTHLVIYQVDLNSLYQTANDTCLLEPAKSWVLEKLTLKSCFLSSFNEEVVTIIVKKTDKTSLEFSELKHFNSGSLEPITSFCSTTEVIYATVIPDTTNIAIICLDSTVYKMYLLNGELSLNQFHY